MNKIALNRASSRSTRIRLFFDQTSDEQLLILSEILPDEEPALPSQFSVRTFAHEDQFLERLVAADLSPGSTSLLAGTVMRVASQRGKVQRWMDLELTEEQMTKLGLDGERVFTQEEFRESFGQPFADVPSFHFADSSSQFYKFLMESPTPFVMLSGPEHRFTFINQPYVDLIGKPPCERC